MKRIGFVIVLLITPLFIYSQSNEKIINNQKYHRLGPTFPTKAYFGREDANWENTTKYGGVLEHGVLYMLNRIPLAENMKLGIDYSYIGIQYHHIKTEYSVAKKIEGVLSLFTKVGPSFTYSPSSKIAFDVYFKAYVPLLAITFLTNGDFGANEMLMYAGYLGLGYASGLNIRYSFLIFNIEYNKANMQLESADYNGKYLGDESNASSKKTPLTGLQITFGFAF